MTYLRDGITFRTCLVAEAWYLDFYSEKQERWIPWPGCFGKDHSNALDALPRCAAIIKDSSYEIGYAHPPRGAAAASEINVGENDESCVQLLQQHGGVSAAIERRQHSGRPLHALRRAGGKREKEAPKKEGQMR